jgi:hypothetical protein
MLGTHAGRVSSPGLVTWMRAWLRGCVPRLAWLRKTAAAVEAGAPVEPGERVLTSVRQVSGGMVVATGHGIYRQDGQPGAAGAGSWSRLGWEDVGRVGWDDRACVLTLTRLRGDGAPHMILLLPGHAPLVELASERVTSTVLASAPVLSRGRICGRLTARRRPGDDHVRWVFTLWDPAASTDPDLPARVSGAIAALEAELGLVSRRLAGPQEACGRDHEPRPAEPA